MSDYINFYFSCFVFILIGIVSIIIILSLFHEPFVDPYVDPIIFHKKSLQNNIISNFSELEILLIDPNSYKLNEFNLIQFSDLHKSNIFDFLISISNDISSISNNNLIISSPSSYDIKSFILMLQTISSKCSESINLFDQQLVSYSQHLIDVIDKTSIKLLNNNLIKPKMISQTDKIEDIRPNKYENENIDEKNNLISIKNTNKLFDNRF